MPEQEASIQANGATCDWKDYEFTILLIYLPPHFEEKLKKNAFFAELIFIP